MEPHYCDGTLKDLSRFADIIVSEELTDEKTRYSALKKAAEISHLVTEVTIGPHTADKPASVKLASSNKCEMVDLTEDRFSDDFRYTLHIKECESQIRDNSDDMFKNLVEKMISSYREKMHGFWKKRNDNLKNKSLELKLEMAKQFQENDNINVLEKTKVEEKKYQIICSQTIENMNRILDEQNKAAARFASITNSHTKIYICYNEIQTLAQTDPFGKQALDNFKLDINSIIASESNIMNFCETGIITEKEVKEAELLALNIELIRDKIKEEINAIKQQQQLRKQKEEETRKKVLEDKRRQEEKAVQSAKIHEAQTKTIQKMFYSEKNFKNYIELDTFLNEYENKYSSLLQNNNLKKFRFDCQKAVNTPVNALSSVSGKHIKDKFDKLAKLLRGERVQVLDTYVTASQHPQGVHYCTALLAKKIMRQGDLLVSSNPESAFPLAAVTVALWSQFPEFGKLLEAYFYRNCPYLVPMLLPKRDGQSDKEFYVSRGYIYNEDGFVEKQDKFLKRMSGIFRLHCAIWIANTPMFLNAPNPHGIRFGWQWLASFINLKPEPDICATLILDFFTVCGSEFLKVYGKQCSKIIKLINTGYMDILQKMDEGGPKTRLEVFLQNVITSGHIKPPNGQLPLNIW